MKRKMIISSVLVTLLASVTLFASKSPYVPYLNEELEHNKMAIKEYKESIKELEKRNAYLEKLKKQNPKLYVKKPLFEEKKDKYIYRVKLEGAKAKNMNMTIKDHIISLEMSLKTERSDKNGYYMSSRSFYQQFSIPKDVNEKKITNRVDGDYFEIVMPKK